jgi:hypothetical protein
VKGDTEVVVMLCFFFAGFGLATVLTREAVPVTLGDIVNPLATLIAAFMGAWTAFRWQSVAKQEEEQKTMVAAGNRALATLMEQVNTLKLFQVDCMEPMRNNPGRHIAMQPLPDYQENMAEFEFKSLNFLLGDPRHHQVLFELSIEDMRFRETLKAINRRSRHHFEVIQPRLAAAGIQEGREYCEKDFKQAIGDFDYIHLQRLTEQVEFHVDRTVDSICSMKGTLRKALLEQLPEGKFLDFELVANPPPSMASTK